MARTFAYGDDKCASDDCALKGGLRIMCYECEKCYHTRCLGPQDRAFKIFVCYDCQDPEDSSSDEDRNLEGLEERTEDQKPSLPCADRCCLKKGNYQIMCLACLRFFHTRCANLPDKEYDIFRCLSCRRKNPGVSSPECNDNDGTSVEETHNKEKNKSEKSTEQDIVKTPCASSHCTMSGRYKVVCLGCKKSYHTGCLDIPDCDHRTFWCDNCSLPELTGISYIDISSVFNKIEQLLHHNIDSNSQQEYLDISSLFVKIGALLLSIDYSRRGISKPNNKVEDKRDDEAILDEISLPDELEMPGEFEFPNNCELADEVEFPDDCELADEVEFPNDCELADDLEFPDCELADDLEFPDCELADDFELADELEMPDEGVIFNEDYVLPDVINSIPIESPSSVIDPFSRLEQEFYTLCAEDSDTDTDTEEERARFQEILTMRPLDAIRELLRDQHAREMRTQNSKSVKREQPQTPRDRVDRHNYAPCDRSCPFLQMEHGHYRIMCRRCHRIYHTAFPLTDNEYQEFMCIHCNSYPDTDESGSDEDDSRGHFSFKKFTVKFR